MRNEIPEKENPSKEIPERQESSREILNGARNFFQNFSQKYREEMKRQPEPDEEEQFLEEVKEMDRQTAPDPEINYDSDQGELTDEELKQILESDPGYVNDKVLDYENEEHTDSNTYQETGSHTGAIHWGDYAAKEGREYDLLPEGTVLSRWGDENGTFLSDVDTPYDSLELPVVQEKNDQKFYEVKKPFPVEISRIAVQPWNQKECEAKEESLAIQYKAPVPVGELLRQGYLKELNM